MAVFRLAEKCPRCGKPYKAIYDKKLLYSNFYGDAFLRWDYAGHKCKELPQQIKEDCDETN